MPVFKFGKLVRDKIVDDQIAEGSRPVFHYLSPDEHVKALVQKIIEEAQEISSAPPAEFASEIADVQQALDDLRELLEVTNEQIVQVRKRKSDKFGDFKKGIFIESVEIDENNKWVAHYRKNADRYPEIGKPKKKGQ